MKMKKVFRIITVLLLFTALMVNSNQTVYAEEKEPTVTWKIPQKIKIGESVKEIAEGTNFPTEPLSEWENPWTGEIFYFRPLATLTNPNLYEGHSDLFGSAGFESHAFEASEVAEDGSVEISVGEDWVSAFKPVTITLQCAVVNSSSGTIIKNIAEPYSVTVEEPVIGDNAPQAVNIGDSIQLTTELQNTALPNRKVSYCLDPENYQELGSGGKCFMGDGHHEAMYEPKVEVIEGQSLVTQSEQDYTNTLNTSEKLAFTGAGTVKLKVTYNQIINCSDIKETYNPEKIITIQVKGNEIVDKSELGTLIKDNQNLDSKNYTAESYAKYEEALKNALVVYNNPNATLEEVAQAKTQLEDAVKALVKLDTGKTETDSDSNKNVVTTSNKTTPKTGDSNMTTILLALVVVSGIAIIVGVRRRLRNI